MYEVKLEKFQGPLDLLLQLIERDTRRARKVSELLEHAIVLNGDAADEELLIEENIDSADVFAAMTAGSWYFGSRKSPAMP